MSARLIEIARETVSIADAGHYTAPSGATVRIDVAAAVAGTRHHRPDEPLAPTGPTATPAVEVTHESTLVAARLAGPGAATLVFASARNPGGGFLRGTVAQEESLARSSALYPTLLTAPDF